MVLVIVAAMETFGVMRLRTIRADAHRLFVATTADGLYVAPGTMRVLIRQATSRTVGTELDVQAANTFSKEARFGAGVGAPFNGDYITRSSAAETLWALYLMY